MNLPDKTLYFLDPASAERAMARVLESEILADDKLRLSFLKNRDRSTERLVMEAVTKVLPEANVYHNYYVEKGSYEKDLMAVHGKTLIIIECKNSKVRAFKGTTDDLLKFENDFENSSSVWIRSSNRRKAAGPCERRDHVLSQGWNEVLLFKKKGRRAGVYRLYHPDHPGAVWDEFIL